MKIAGPSHPPIFSFWLRQKEKTGRGRSKREKPLSRKDCFRFQECLQSAAWLERGFVCCRIDFLLFPLGRLPWRLNRREQVLVELTSGAFCCFG